MSPEVVLTALYLRGAPRPADPPRRGWPQALAALRREGGGDPVRVLRSAGLTLPASILEAPGLLVWAEDAVEAGAVLTAGSEGYPLRWLEAFGDLAPPALWRTGTLPSVGWVGAVGSRQVESEVLDYMNDVGHRAAGLGRGLVSGGAVGCDTAAERSALAAGGPVLRLLPHGIGLRREDDAAVQVALAAPQEPFSRPLAMERNALIYGAADVTVVGHLRLRQGGTWNGAADALRRRLGRLLVRPDDSAAAKALRALGAEEMAEPSELEARLAQAPPQRNLFAYERRRRVFGATGL